MLPDLFKRLKPLYGVVIDHLWIEYQLANPQRRSEIEELLLCLAVRRLGTRIGQERIVLDPPPAPTIGEGDYVLGAVIYPGLAPYPARLGKHELLRHMFVLGPTGTGKSTLLLGLVQQVVADGVPCWIFDFKRNYRCLLGASIGKKIKVFTVGRNVAPLQINCLRAPPGVLIEEWIEALADIMSAAYLLMQGARNVLKDVLFRACDIHGPTATLWHTYRLLREDMRQTRVGSRRHGWTESAARTLEELSTGSFGTTLNAQDAVPFADLLDVSIVFEAQNLGDDQKRFFCLFALQYILLLRKHGEHPREQLLHSLVFDESHYVFPKDQYGEFSVPSRLAREIREYGEGIIAASQQADVSDSLIANAGFKIILRCDFPRDVDFASKLLQVEPRWISKLPMGQAFVRFPTRWYQPFLIEFPPQPLKNILISDQVLAEHQTTVVRRNTTSPSLIAEDKDDLLLRDIAFNPISGIVERYARLSWNAKTGHTVTRRLLARRLVAFEQVSTAKARLKILTLTVDGRAYLHEQGLTLPPKARGGIEHEYWRHTLKERFVTKGYEVQAEHLIGDGQAVDLYATKRGVHFYVEIETGKSDIQSNIQKCGSLNGTVIFFFTSPALSERHSALPENYIALGPQDLDQIDRF
jgi:hypothetical protein